MPIAIIDAHRELESVARTFLEKAGVRAESRALLDAPDEGIPSFWKTIADMGWLGLHLSEDFGGAGYGLPELVVIAQEMGRAVAPGPFLPTVMASAAIARTASKEQQAELLPTLADGSKTAALGWTNSLTLADGKLSGDGGLVLGAGLADLFVLVAGNDLVVVERDAPGLEIRMSGQFDATRRSGFLKANDIAVSADRVIEGGAAVAVDVARALASAEAAGGAQECVDRATEYAKVREQFGRVIATFQAVKHHCANMLVSSELATASTWDAARASENDPEQFRLAAAVAATESIPAFLTNSQLNIQVHGGIGFTWEHDGHMLLRRASTLVAFVDADAAARDVTDIRLGGVQRQFGIDLPPEAEELRTKTRAAVEEIAALPSDQQLTKLVETGYVQPHWPKPWGREAKALEQLVIDEEFKRAGVNRPSYGITAWNILTIIQHGTAEQVERWVRPTLMNELVWCQLFSEPDAGSDAAAVKTKAERVDGGFVVNGQKVWTSGAQYCHRGLATVRTDPDAQKHAGVTTLVIDMHADGVEVRPLREASGHAMFNEVFFTNVFVPDEDVVGPVNGGWTVARATLGNERVSIGGGVGIGISLDLVSIYRDHGEGVDGAKTDVGKHVAEEQTLRLLNLRSAERAVAGGEPGPEGNVTKLVSAESMQRSSDLALKLAGPEVVSVEGIGGLISNIHIFSRAMTIAGGTSEITRNQIGERILGLPRDPLIK
jgi:alkylation response protein AidB-like acyl-CoA dehydrogenase